MKKTFLIILSSILASSVFASVKLPSIFSDNMVLQQNAEARFWGWASPGEKISITPSWSKKTVFTKADESGNWKVSVPTPAAGGPFDIKINGEFSLQNNRQPLKTYPHLPG